MLLSLSPSRFPIDRDAYLPILLLTDRLLAQHSVVCPAMPVSFSRSYPPLLPNSDWRKCSWKDSLPINRSCRSSIFDPFPRQHLICELRNFQPQVTRRRDWGQVSPITFPIPLANAQAHPSTTPRWCGCHDRAFSHLTE